MDLNEDNASVLKDCQLSDKLVKNFSSLTQRS